MNRLLTAIQTALPTVVGQQTKDTAKELNPIMLGRMPPDVSLVGVLSCKETLSSLFALGELTSGQSLILGEKHITRFSFSKVGLRVHPSFELGNYIVEISDGKNN